MLFYFVSIALGSLQFGFGFSFLGLRGLEGEAVQSELPVDVRDRGRPSAQFARESNPIISTRGQNPFISEPNSRHDAKAQMSMRFHICILIHFKRINKPTCYCVSVVLVAIWTINKLLIFASWHVHRSHLVFKYHITFFASFDIHTISPFFLI